MTTRARRFFLNEIAKQNRGKKKALRFLMTSLCLRSIDMQL